jgi:hypothetical protein
MSMAGPYNLMADRDDFETKITSTVIFVVGSFILHSVRKNLLVPDSRRASRVDFAGRTMFTGRLLIRFTQFPLSGDGFVSIMPSRRKLTNVRQPPCSFP